MKLEGKSELFRMLAPAHEDSGSWALDAGWECGDCGCDNIGFFYPEGAKKFLKDDSTTPTVNADPTTAAPSTNSPEISSGLVIADSADEVQK